MKRLLTVLAVAVAVAGCGGSRHSPPAAHAAAAHGYQTPWGVQAHPLTFGLPPKGEPQTLSIPTAATTLEMVDSVVDSAYPLSFQAAAGYTSGYWVTYPYVHAHFRYPVSIAVSAGQTLDNFGRPIRCLDVEPGDATPAQAGGWDRQIVALGGRPCDYENVSTLPAVRASILAAGLTPAQVDLFVADWTFRPHLYPGSACTQWTDHGPQGQNYDESTCTLAFLGAPPPVSKAAGVANAEVSENVATGKWTIRPLPGKVTFGAEPHGWSGLEVQRHRGAWRAQPLSFNAKPLGG
jgi:hypothetical protein